MARPKGTIDRVQTGLRMKKTLFRQLQHLSIDIETPLNVIVEEAIEEYLVSRGFSKIAEASETSCNKP
jgi:predicted DNA-binding protein